MQNDNSYEIAADVPGVSKGDINLSVDGDVMTISTDKKEEKVTDDERDGHKWHRVERSQM